MFENETLFRSVLTCGIARERFFLSVWGLAFPTVPFALATVCILFPVNSSVSASSDKPRFVVLGGDAIGLRLETEVYITGKFEVTTNTGKIQWMIGYK